MNTLEERLEKMTMKIKSLEDEVDRLYTEVMKSNQRLSQIRELQEVVAKIAGEPVGMLFMNYRG